MAKGRQSTAKQRRIPRREVTWEDQVHKIAVIGKGTDVPVKEKIKIAELICDMYARNKHNLQQCLDHCGIRNRNTWLSWCRQIAQIDELYLKAKELRAATYDNDLAEQAETMAEKLINGYTETLREREGYFTEITDESGQVRREFITTKLKEKQIFVKPSPQVLLQVLYNRKPKKWSRDPDQHAPEDIPQKINFNIVGNGNYPVFSEEQIKDE